MRYRVGVRPREGGVQAAAVEQLAGAEGVDPVREVPVAVRCQSASSTYSAPRTANAPAMSRRRASIVPGCSGGEGLPTHRRVAQVPLGVERGLTAGSRRRDRLAVSVVDEIAGGEDAGPVGPRGASLDERSRSRRPRPSRARARRRTCPIATNAPVTAQLALLGGLGVAQPRHCERAVRHRAGAPPRRRASSNSMFGSARARSSMIREARNSSRRWTIATLRVNLARKIASSIAESPPPTTIASWFLKKAASQVAQ